MNAILAIERHETNDYARFADDELIQSWYVIQLEIIGEAARALPEEVRALAPKIEWFNIIGMRNILAHGYFNIEPEIVWSTVKSKIPVLKLEIERLIETMENQQ